MRLPTSDWILTTSFVCLYALLLPVKPPCSALSVSRGLQEMVAERWPLPSPAVGSVLCWTPRSAPTDNVQALPKVHACDGTPDPPVTRNSLLAQVTFLLSCLPTEYPAVCAASRSPPRSTAQGCCRRVRTHTQTHAGMSKGLFCTSLTTTTWTPVLLQFCK